MTAINADLHDRQALIADGHHRYATYRVLQRQEHEIHLRADAASAEPANGDQPTPPPAEPTAEPTGPTARPARPAPPADQAPEPTHPAARPTHPEPPPTGPTPKLIGPAAEPARPAPIDPASPQVDPASSQVDPASSQVDSAGAGQHEPSQQVDGAETDKDGPAAGAGRSTAGPWDFGLALLVDTSAYPPDLKAIHRVIPGLPLDEAAARAKGSWRVHDFDDLAQGLAALEEAAEPAFLLAGESGAHLLTDPDPVQLAHAMPPERSDRWNSLNTSVLSEFVMPKVWGMRDDERTVRIVHHDAWAAMRLAARSGGTAVILKPLKAEEVLAVAAGGERVPRKSTSFGPKPRTGLILRTFAID
ncbi:DUF1015 family protein [Nonomuraea deserti]|uniref:DUF1015 family protein n=1 Tax=Nonomuraea deserti TaxID=1848322 RepID=A0A4R4UD36_9ACTN|nr:DUF1015 family protein [Nonomuraea deserti]